VVNDSGFVESVNAAALTGIDLSAIMFTVAREVAAVIIKSMRVSNFRSLLEETLNCEALTVLVGPNGAGKSSFLRALELFYAPTPIVTADDFYNHDTSREIEIAITFTDLVPKEIERFSHRMSGSDLLVMRVLTSGGGKNSGKYYGFRLQNPEFSNVRATAGRELLSLYRELRENKGYDLPTVRSQADAEAAMEEWESANTDKLELGRDDGQFFGFTNVARGYLGDLTRFLFIPAVRDAAEDVIEGRSSAITALMNLVVRATLTSRKEIAELKEAMQSKFEAITDPANLPELGLLAGRLADTLNHYYADTGVKINWQKGGEIDLPLPKADVRIVEDEFEMPVTRMGHGLQRAFILTLLQHLAVASAPKESAEVSELESPESSSESEDATKLSLIIGIEEPELYQHPSRQRHFARILLDLAQGRIQGVAARTQIIYASHSALLVDIDRFNQVRRVTRKPTEDGLPKVSSVAETDWDKVAEIIWKADGSQFPKYTGVTLKPRVAPVMTPWMNEGFFADTVVLVEGEDDRAAILGMAQLKTIDLEALGCTVIPCLGKHNMDRPAVIFSEMKIPTYLIWDGDHHDYKENEKSNEEECKKTNRRLLNICGQVSEDWPCGVSQGHACFHVDLETTLRDEIGPELFDKLVEECRANLRILKKKHALKNPMVIESVLKSAAEKGKKSRTMEAIVTAIVERAKVACSQSS
jgi:predicted ATP-dependent endonuclease of OLD family